LEGWWIFFGARYARARARSTRAHVRNLLSSVLPKSTVQNFGRSRFEKACRQKFSTLFFHIFFLQIFQKFFKYIVFHHAQKRTPQQCPQPE
jgi:hypothetical protein